jgi:hypothetical protein
VSECFKSQTTTGWRALPAVSCEAPFRVEAAAR